MEPEYRVRIGIWEDGPVVYLSEEALKSFEERRMYVLYDSRDPVGYTIQARIKDKAICFFPLPTNQVRQTRIILPRENDQTGWYGMIHVTHPLVRTHEVRCALFEAAGHWEADNHFVIPMPLPHTLPYPPERAMTLDQIERDIRVRRAEAEHYTGRPHLPDPPPHYARLMGHVAAETGEAPE